MEEEAVVENVGISEAQGNGQIFYADELDVTFGMPWFNDGLCGDLQRFKEVSRKKHRTVEEQEWLEGVQETAVELAQLRLAQKYAESVDPVKYGFTLKGWRRVMRHWKDTKVIVIFGGNRAAKSIFASRLVVHLAKNIPEANIRCFHQNEKRSREEQQKHVWEALPLDANGIPIKSSLKTKGKNFSLDYKQKTGFSGNKCILPPLHAYQTMGSTINFNTYQQFYARPNVFEGTKEHLIWMDEEAPFKLFETLLPRLVDFHGKMLLTFTTIDGYTELVSKLIAGAKTREDIYVPWLGEKVPLVQESVNFPGCKIFYFHSEDNPFVDFKEIFNTYSLSSKDVQKTRLLGIPQKLFVSKFPKFNLEVHVVKKEMIPVKNVTRYQSVDPAGGKNWVMIWYCVDEKGDIWVYREFPDKPTYGAWAEPWNNAIGKPVGKPGPAQRGVGMGYMGYANLIREMEMRRDEEGSYKPEKIFERVIDMRYAHREVMSQESTVDMAGEMAKHRLYFRGGYDSDIETGLQKINDYLDYKTNEPISEHNRPKLFISEECQNLISCMQEYTAKGGNDESSKDFIDVLRYALTTDPVYINDKIARKSGGFAY